MKTFNFCSSSVMLTDLTFLSNIKQQLENSFNAKKYQHWHDLLLKSQARVQERKELVPKISYPEALPVSKKKQEIKDLINNNKVVVIAGETGSGKTTQLPKICLELGLSNQGLIGHTQPRRIAAQTIAQRISEELTCNLGEQIGYQVRFNNIIQDSSLVKLMTDGILLTEIKTDPLLLKYQTIIIDEAHERSLNSDILISLLTRIAHARCDLAYTERQEGKFDTFPLRIVIMSATLRVKDF